MSAGHAHEGAPGDDFSTARAAFSQRAATAAGGAEGLNVYPNAPGDHYDVNTLGELQTGPLRAFKATANRRTVLQGFAHGSTVAAPPPAVLQALASGKPVDVATPGLARLLTAARLGQPDALPHRALRARLKFLFEPAGKFGRLCPIATDGSQVQIRWQFQITTGRPRPRGAVPIKKTWLTLTYDTAEHTARLRSGDDGC